MEKKTYIITLDEKSSYVGVMPAFGNSRYDKVTITKPVSVTALDGFPVLCRSEALENEHLAGQNEAWELARKIVGSPVYGGYSCPELKDIFGSGAVGTCIRNNTYQEAVDKIKKWEETVNIQVGDVLVSTGNIKSLVTYIGDDYMCLLFSDGSCGQMPKDDIKEFYKKTGQRFDTTTISDLLKEEEE